jgi:hypothetical protein
MEVAEELGMKHRNGKNRIGISMSFSKIAIGVSLINPIRGAYSSTRYGQAPRRYRERPYVSNKKKE